MANLGELTLTEQRADIWKGRYMVRIRPQTTGGGAGGKFFSEKLLKLWAKIGKFFRTWYTVGGKEQNIRKK